MKDAATCDKPRRGGNNLRPGDFRMGQPSQSHVWLYSAESIGRSKRTEGTETSKYLQEEKTTVISLVAASETEIA
jgi:hypothetical protein